MLELFIEPNDGGVVENADNVTVAPWGDLLLCEDEAGPGDRTNCIVGVTPAGKISIASRNSGSASELAGACFSPDGSTLFLNIQTDGARSRSAAHGGRDGLGRRREAGHGEKFASSRGPCTVMKLSGWNCTPSHGVRAASANVRRNPITTRRGCPCSSASSAPRAHSPAVSSRLRRRNRRFIHDERVIAGRLERVRHASEDAQTVVMHHAGLAMHRHGVAGRSHAGRPPPCTDARGTRQARAPCPRTWR
jgi:hypothetical protein